ncbi:hypothetical protein RND81_11G089400 [Saponaria officinalis]|uniref:Transmembrane protein n=1 Tax=Saponaria officinalis TaxID=3572 RepID=A0AAW1HJP8_SAPOF
MEQFHLIQLININKIMKKPNFPCILSVILISFSFTFVSLYTMISSTDLCSSILSNMKFTIGRNHMFILCNGILVILVKSSSSSSSSQEINSDDEIITKTVDNCQKMSTEQKSSFDEITIEKNYSVTTEKLVVVEEIEYTDDYYDVNDDYDNDRNDEDEDEDEDDEGEDAEELNRRCEDFIRRMKQGIIFESRQNHGLVSFS